LKQAGVGLPLLVGGAALSDRFTRGRIAPAYEGTVVYCNDAMNGLDTLNRLMDPDQRTRLEAELLEREHAGAPPTPAGEAYPETETRSARIALDVPIAPVPDLDRHLEEALDLDEIWTYVNPQMLYGRHLGFRGRFSEALAAGDVKAVELERKIDAVKQECREGAMHARAVWQFFEAEGDGNRIHVFEPGGVVPLETFAFPRQRKPDGLALSDLVLPPRRDARGRALERDHIAIFVTTAGAGIRERAELAKAAGEYVRSYALMALALETAEGAAEWLHARLRAAWGFPDPPELSRKELFQARYRGKRYSFGYPACPDLEQQAKLFRLLRPEEVGVQLTEGFMMEPEASVSALVFHHPDAAYFSVGTGDAEDADLA
ncbi:MAG TPA: vitamin B12 dependent-methionine synthase activation domain-containing protein, partial [Dehalococcoidia bacterium]|nr:vitamin B12 dependent-methionine synthase activation domain-containing protein [Dehalococcoidia bacterium]